MNPKCFHATPLSYSNNRYIILEILGTGKRKEGERQGKEEENEGKRNKR